ncbi:MAG: hypothetical protein ACO3AS_12320, partial [Burkholderiaceae bacterium]
MIKKPRRRVVQFLGLSLFAGGSLSACSALDTVSSWMPWSSSKPKLPALPELAGKNLLEPVWRAKVDDVGQGFAPTRIEDKLVVATK